MNATVTRRPYLQHGDCVTADYDCEWLEYVLHQAAERAGIFIPSEREVAQGLLRYMDRYCPLRTVPLRYFFGRVRCVLREIGLPRVAEALQEQFPPIAIPLDTLAGKNPLPLFFYAELKHRMDDLKRRGLTAYRFSGAHRCSLVLGRRRRSCPTQRRALHELEFFLSTQTA